MGRRQLLCGGTDSSRGQIPRQLPVTPEIDAVHLADIEGKGRLAALIPLHRHLGDDQRFHAVLRINRDLSASRAGRPAVLIVQPCFHAVCGGDIRDLVDKFKPFLAQVLGNESRARVHEVAAQPHLLHDVCLPHQLLAAQLAVP